MPEPPARAATLEALTDTLLPGDALFPRGSAVGVEGKLAERLIEVDGERALDELDRALEAAGGLDPAAEATARTRVVARLEETAPELFAKLRTIAYLAYYESPLVQDAIRALGFAYNPAPLPKGYDVGRFDRERDRPNHRRGRYIPTEEVSRVDLSGLDIEELRHG